MKLQYRFPRRRARTGPWLALWLAFAAVLAAQPGPQPSGSKPERLVSLCVQGDQLLLQLVPRGRIAMLSQFAADPDISVHWKEASGIPASRGTLEELARLKPDLILVAAHSAPSMVAILEKQGVRVLKLGVPNDFVELRDQILLVGRRVGEEVRAAEIVRAMDARLERIEAKRPPPGARPTALFYFQDGFVPGGRSFANAILDVAGFRNLGAQFNPGMGASASLESVILARPAVLILTRYCEANPTQTQLDWGQPLFRKLGARTKIVSVPFNQLASPDPANLDLAETLQQSLSQ